MVERREERRVPRIKQYIHRELYRQHLLPIQFYPAASSRYRALLHLPGPESHKLSSDIHHTLTHDSTLHSSTLAPGKLGFIAHNRSGSNSKYGGGKVFLLFTYDLQDSLTSIIRHCQVPQKIGDKECAFCDQPVNGR